MEDQWGKKAANQLRSQRENLERGNAAQLHRDKLRHEQGPRLWNEVREHVKSKCASLNLEDGADVLTFMLVQSSTLDVRFKAPSGRTHILTASFEPSSADNALRWKTSGHRMNDGVAGTCELHIKNDVVGFLTGAHPYTPESIAEKMLEDLLRD